MSKDTTFLNYSKYYDLLYQDKDYSAEVDYIKSLLLQNGVVNGNILEFGSGTGIHGRLLSNSGYKVHGIENSMEMVSICKLTDNFTCQQGDITSIKLGRTFDAVISLFHVISYQTTNIELHAVFNRAAEHLKPSGILIFDFWYSPAVYNIRPTIRVKRMKNLNFEITRIAEPTLFNNENRVDVNFTLFVKNLSSGMIESFSETHKMRHFSLPELDLLAEANNFKRVNVEEFLSKANVSESTWGVCVTYQKIDNE